MTPEQRLKSYLSAPPPPPSEIKGWLDLKIVEQPTPRFYGTAARYATALYKLAQKQNEVPKVASELQKMLGCIQSSATIGRFTSDPTLPRTTKKEAFVAVLDKTSFSTTTKNLVGLLADNGRLAMLPSVVDTFSRLVAAARGEVLVNVTSAKKLTAEEVQVLQGAFTKLLSGAPFQLSYMVSSDILGGLVINIGNTRCDMSVATELKKLEKWLLTAP
eukprot:CAMPEP_0196655164 /NCGR_PEP_ID=MMETSP1086-20130531/4903_1 /TAXON_ID=77921 /ORGANISM="Cyanoptyche  gloeocystis , Strain SAG4.97" /LENGTH=216 /DNA_ID=CAMNT_0041987323 /DNA_START=150 /DNA_END=800 /DNA_ORIENTATION=-